MTEQFHPMIPPREPLKQWENDWFAEREHADVLLIQAYQAGADAELEACCALLELSFEFDVSACEDFRAARRPPPTLKEQAWKLLETYGTSGVKLTADQCNTIRRALEQIDD